MARERDETRTRMYTYACIKAHEDLIFELGSPAAVAIYIYYTVICVLRLGTLMGGNWIFRRCVAVIYGMDCDFLYRICYF